MLKKIILQSVLLLSSAGLVHAQFSSGLQKNKLQIAPETRLSSSFEEGRNALFFNHMFGAEIIALGQSPKMELGSIQNVGVGFYYSPQLTYEVGEISSVCLGTNAQILLNADAGLLLGLPFTLGYSIGAGSTRSEDAPEFGAFVNAGLGTAFFLSTDPGDEDMRFIRGPYIDFGFRSADYEMKFSILKAFKNTNDAFIISVGVGRVF